MLSEAPALVLVCAVVLLALVVPVAVLAMPRWWHGSSELGPESPPLGWTLSPQLWRRLAYGLSVSLPMLALAALAVLLSRVSLAAANTLLGPVVVLAFLWVTEVFFARPRFLIPPSWRPGRTRSTAPDQGH